MQRPDRKIRPVRRPRPHLTGWPVIRPIRACRHCRHSRSPIAAELTRRCRGNGGDTPTRPGAKRSTPTANAISGNPAATNIVAGSGRLGELLGINRNGIRFGGLNITDANGNLAGGLGPGKWTGDTLTIADLSIDLEKFAGWEGRLVRDRVPLLQRLRARLLDQ